MSGPPPTPLDHDLASVADGVELLERAIGYTRLALAGVRPDRLADPTPCQGWTLGDLLAHMDDSLAAFVEASAGWVALETPAGPGTADPVARLQEQACALLGSWTARAEAPGPGPVAVGDRSLGAGVLLRAAAVEVTVHGWDVTATLAAPRATPLGPPADLGLRLLPVAHLLVAPGDRPGRFAPPVDPAPGASAGARLIAFLGRRPAR